MHHAVDRDVSLLSGGGRHLYRGLRDPRDPADVHALVIEACRVKDRLDSFQRLVSSDDSEWAALIPAEGEGEFILEISGAVREKRQSEIVFKQLTAEIARMRSEYDDDDLDDAGGLADL